MAKKDAKNDNSNSNNNAAADDDAAAQATADDAAAAQAAANAQSADTPLTQADVERAIKKARKDWEKEKADADATAKLSEDERLKKENADLKRAIQMDKAETEVTKALEKAGAKSAALLFNVKKGDLQFDDNGKITNLSDILDDLKSDYADQFAVEKPNESIDGGAGGSGGGGNGTPLTKAAIDKMTPEQIAANMPAIDAFLATQK